MVTIFYRLRYSCHMSNLQEVHCPACGRHIATLATPPGGRTDAENEDLSTRVEEWLVGHTWHGQRGTTELFDAYRRDTGDDLTSHRRWSVAMQSVGVLKARGAKGARVFIR